MVAARTPRRDRSLATLAALVALGAEHELAMHVRAALRNGSPGRRSPRRLLHTALYAGLPRANRAFAVAQQVLDEGRLNHPYHLPTARYCRPVTSPEKLTHLDQHGAARMVDVSGKEVTTPHRDAAGRFCTTPEVIACCAATACPRAMPSPWPGSPASPAAKRTPDLVPLCHPVALHGVTVDLELATTASTSPRPRAPPTAPASRWRR